MSLLFQQLAGSHQEAIWLTRIYSLSLQNTSAEGWTPKPYKELQQEIGVGVKSLHRFTAKYKKLGIVDTKTIGHQGVRKLHIALRQDELCKYVCERLGVEVMVEGAKAPPVQPAQPKRVEPKVEESEDQITKWQQTLSEDQERISLTAMHSGVTVEQVLEVLPIWTKHNRVTHGLESWQDYRGYHRHFYNWAKMPNVNIESYINKYKQTPAQIEPDITNSNEGLYVGSVVQHQ